MKHWMAAGLVLMGVMTMRVRAGAQASTLPSAAPSAASESPERGRVLIQQAVEAMGGERWEHRGLTRIEGRSGVFYKGQPNPYEAQFERYLRPEPFAERDVIVSRMGVFIPTNKRDVAEVWTPDAGYEITFRGKKALPVKDVEDFQRRRRHSLEVVLGDWIKRPGTIISYEGSGMDERRLVDRVSVITTDNDSVTLGLDAGSHLPRSLTYIWRDPLYKDLNTDITRYDNWQPEDNVMTPLTTTRFHNGDMTGQTFLTRVQYNQPLPQDLFDPERPLQKSTKK